MASKDTIRSGWNRSWMVSPPSYVLQRGMSAIVVSRVQTPRAHGSSRWAIIPKLAMTANAPPKTITRRTTSHAHWFPRSSVLSTGAKTAPKSANQIERTPNRITTPNPKYGMFMPPPNPAPNSITTRLAPTRTTWISPAMAAKIPATKPAATTMTVSPKHTRANQSAPGRANDSLCLHALGTCVNRE